MVHITSHPRDDDHRDMHSNEDHESEHDQEVERPSDLAVTWELGIPKEPVGQGWRHRRTAQDRQRGQHKNRGEIGQLLQRVIVVEPVGFLRHVKSGVIDENIPRIRHNLPGDGHKSLPLVSAQQQDDKYQAVDDPKQHAEEMPVARHTNGVAPARKADPRREIPGIVLRRPDPVPGHHYGGEAQPLAAGSAMEIPFAIRWLSVKVRFGSSDVSNEPGDGFSVQCWIGGGSPSGGRPKRL